MISELPSFPQMEAVPFPPTETLGLLTEVSTNEALLSPLKASAAELMLGFDAGVRRLSQSQAETRKSLVQLEPSLIQREGAELIETLTALIEACESAASELVNARAGLIQAAKIVEARRSSPGGATIRGLFEYFIHQADDLIQEMLDQALFLRSFRAEHGGNKGKGKTFETVDDLRGFLEGLEQR